MDFECPADVPAAEWAIEARGLVKRFGGRPAVCGVDFNVKAGSICGVLGPNGAGKTTMIRILATLLKPDEGSASIFGFDVVKRAHAVRKLIGLTGQYASVDESLTAFENLYLYARLLGTGRRDARRRAEELLERFGLTEAARRPLKQFSGGTRRRLDLAAGFIAQPPLLFLDEPTVGLDPRSRNMTWDMIRSLAATGSTVLLTTQYLDEADQLADRIAVIDRGRVVAEGTADELKASAGTATLHLKVRHLSDMALVREMAERILDVRTGVKAEPGVITAPAAGAGQAADLLIALRDRGIPLAEFSVQKPTLDEVFLAITGRSAAENEGQEGAAKHEREGEPA